MADDFAIKVENVSKTFKLPHEKNNSIKGAIVNFYKHKKTYEKQEALKDVSFEVKKGEFFGIVGRNGSGKSTLLKLLAGIYTPTEGQVHVRGKLTPFIELGVGFNPELTGRENVFLNGALLGFNRKEMSAMYDDIVEFAEIERFMDQKLKNYSSGMQVRLAFSIAIQAKSDILVLDEVLAVGDAAFQYKCFEYFNGLKKNKQTVVFVSHDMTSVRKYCDRVVLIDSGRVVAAGRAAEVIPEYLKVFLDEAGDKQPPEVKQRVPLGMTDMVNRDRTRIKIGDVWLESANKKIKKIDDETESITIKMKLIALKNVSRAIPGVIITNQQGEFITASNSRWGGHKGVSLSNGERATVEFTLPNIYEKGSYQISVNVVSDNFDTFLDWKNEISQFESQREFETGAKTNPKYKFEVESNG